MTDSGGLDGKEMLEHIAEFFEDEYGRSLELLTVAEIGPDIAGRDLTDPEMIWIHDRVTKG